MVLYSNNACLSTDNFCKTSYRNNLQRQRKRTLFSPRREESGKRIATCLPFAESGPRAGPLRAPDRDMYQIILIIENGGNVTPTRCRVVRRRETVLAHENGTVNYNASSPRTIMLPQCRFPCHNGCYFNGSPVANFWAC